MKSLSEVLTFVSSIDGWLSSHEGYFLYTAAAETKRGEVVEIGSWMGKSTICLAAGSQSVKGSKVYAVDPHEGKFTKGSGFGKHAPTYILFQDNLKKLGVLNHVKSLVTTSEKAAKTWKKEIGLLFIDGLHDYNNAKLDFSLWAPLLIKRGVVALHDSFCGHDGPERIVIEGILRNNSWSGIGVVGSIIYARKEKADFLGKLDVWRHRILIPIALKLNKSNMPNFIKFILIHRIIKLLLLNRYTLGLFLNYEKN